MKKYLQQHFAKNYLGEINLAQLSYLKIGAVAPHCLLLNDTFSLSAFEHYVAGKYPYRVLGKCSNILISDKAVDEIIVFIAPDCRDVWPQLPRQKPNHIIFAAGLPYSQAMRLAHKRFLGGLEFALGIPGSIGGAVRMNAGAEQCDTQKYLTHAFLFRGGICGWVEKDFLSMSYRHSNIQDDEIVLGAAFLLDDLDKAQLQQKKIESLNNLQKRKSKQPLAKASLGSTFKNPQGYHAAKLIEEAGLSGFRVGGVSISQKHANFLENDGSGTAQNVVHLIKIVQEKVFQHFGVTLEKEIVFLGRF